MIPKECKRLAEVDFPVAVVSKHAAREKSIRHGHPATLHLWWARRPLASCRAMLLALLLPDPCDQHCPEDFKDNARTLLSPVVGRVGPKNDDLRAALFKFIGNFANWDYSTDQTFVGLGRALVAAAHPDETPLIVDPFAGGGSIPLEALRLGCHAFASDINPVATLILKTMLQDIPGGGPGYSSHIRQLGKQVLQSVAAELDEFYPIDEDGARPITYLWARTMRCESPNCGVEFPLARSFWLSKKKNKSVAVRFTSRKNTDINEPLTMEVFSPLSSSEVPAATAVRGKATCPLCGTTMDPSRVKSQLREMNGGAHVMFNEDGARIGGAILLAVVTYRKERPSKAFRSPSNRDYTAVWRTFQKLEQEFAAKIPDEPLPYPPHPDGQTKQANFSFIPIRLYGLSGWSDIFTKRQQLALLTLCEHIAALPNVTDRRIMAMVLGRCADYWSASAMWAQSRQGGEFVAHTFGRQALPMVWDFAEAVPIANGSGSLQNSIDWVARVVERIECLKETGQTELANATQHPLPDASAAIWFTDPPYYDSVPYSYLSDFFLIWLKRALGTSLSITGGFPIHEGLTDRTQEIISELPMLSGVNKRDAKKLGYLVKDHVTFENAMAAAFCEGARVIKEDGIGSVVFAHKTTEGWEALLSGLTKGGWVITGSWPIATERPGRLRAKDSAALATSVHLVCRPRKEDSVGDWAEVLRELPSRVGDWVGRLEHEGIRGADLVFACIGPALEIFSRHSRVETADGREVSLGEFLEKVWETVGRTALKQVLGTAEAQAQNGLAGALEEDARLTALFLWTLQSTYGEVAVNNRANSLNAEELEEDDDVASRKSKNFSLMFDVARRFAQPLGIRLPEWEGRIIETKKGIVRLIGVTERGRQLFGESGTSALADEIEASPLAAAQLTLFVEETPPVHDRGRHRGKPADTGTGDLVGPLQTTTLDRVHAAMLLQASGRSQALRSLLKVEQERGPDFIRLANALSALYPRSSEEKRLLDAMLLAIPR